MKDEFFKKGDILLAYSTRKDYGYIVGENKDKVSFIEILSGPTGVGDYYTYKVQRYKADGSKIKGQTPEENHNHLSAYYSRTLLQQLKEIKEEIEEIC